MRMCGLGHIHKWTEVGEVIYDTDYRMPYMVNRVAFFWTQRTPDAEIFSRLFTRCFVMHGMCGLGHIHKDSSEYMVPFLVTVCKWALYFSMLGLGFGGVVLKQCLHWNGQNECPLFILYSIHA